MFGPMLYNWGYSNYYNPYYGGYGGNTVVAAADRLRLLATDQSADGGRRTKQSFPSAMTTFRIAPAKPSRRAIMRGRLTWSTRHEDDTERRSSAPVSRGLCLFALKRYDEAAATLYAVLWVGPGWDWTTLISFYGDPETYTEQLRALRLSVSQNPSRTAAVCLAYQYLTEGHAEAAIRQLQIVTSLQPKDHRGAVGSAAPKKLTRRPAATDAATGLQPGAAATTPAVSDTPAPA